MFRNLIQKLPTFQRTRKSEFSHKLPKGGYRSLSPFQIFSGSSKPQRSQSCPPEKRELTENVDVKSTPRSYSRESRHGSNGRMNDKYETEIKWRESPIPAARARESKQLDEESIGKAHQREEFIPPLQQYELEAAKPREPKSTQLIEAFQSKTEKTMYGVQLQPNELKPFGSQDNLYSPILIKPASAVKGPTRRRVADEEVSQIRLPRDDFHRNYSTDRMAFKIPSRFDICPPNFYAGTNDAEEDNERVEFVTPEMREARRLTAISGAEGVNYKPSYSDRMKLLPKGVSKIERLNVLAVDMRHKARGVCIDIQEKRALSTHSGNAAVHKPVDLNRQQRNDYSKSKTEDCSDVCTEMKRRRQPRPRYTAAHEPKPCNVPTPTKIYLPSKVKLSVPPCTPRPAYEDCKPINYCPPRADDCLTMHPKKLPLLEAKECPCVEPEPPKFSPKLRRLPVKSEDPPKEACLVVDACVRPRADDAQPYSYKPLRPYVPGTCACVDEPPMTNVKLKRLPKCEPEDVCRPVRVCPPPTPCPPRADESLVEQQKKLPVLETKPCACLEEPRMKPGPPLVRLDLDVAQPPRACPTKDDACTKPDRADKDWVSKKKTLPAFVPGDCPCEDRPMTDVKLRRLRCVDEPQECVVPDPCTTFPRADWGCWEYVAEECAEVDPECVIDRKGNCETEKKVSKAHACDKPDVCRTHGTRDVQYDSRRRYNTTASGSMGLFNRIKGRVADVPDKPTVTVKVKRSKRKIASPTLVLVRRLRELDRHKPHGLLFEPQIEGSEVNRTPADNYSGSVKVKSRKREVAKKTCSTMRPPEAQPCRDGSCPKHEMLSCSRSEQRPLCNAERVPVCCEKEEAPYVAYSERAYGKIEPYTSTSQWTCGNSRYGFHPNNKKKRVSWDKSETKTKKFSTAALIGELPHGRMSYKGLQKPDQSSKILQRDMSGRAFNPRARDPDKGLLNRQTYASKLFQIDDSNPNRDADDDADRAISCVDVDDDVASNPGKVAGPSTPPAKPPYPAFSDCLNQDLEPKFLNAKTEFYKLNPPEPEQGKIDVLKEQECIREKLAVEYEGLTQTCSDFGDPVELVKSRDIFSSHNKDCARIEELKKLGRWPPKTIRQNRRFSTVTGLNAIRELSGEYLICQAEVRRIHVRHVRTVVDNWVPAGCKRCYSTIKFGPQRWRARSKCDRSKKPCPKFTLSNCPPVSDRGRCQREPITQPSVKPFTPYASYSENDGAKCSFHEECECLQPRYPILPEIESSKQFPTADKLDPSLNRHYLQCKHGTRPEGLTLDCDTFEKYVAAKSRQGAETVEFVVDSRCDDEGKTTCCSQTPRETVEEIEPKPCEYPPPGHIPEEDSKCLKEQRGGVIAKSKMGGASGPVSFFAALWQLMANYFRARPNCPEPGDYKRMALRVKAEKAAKAAGLVAVDPNCVPPEVLKTIKSNTDCLPCSSSSSPARRQFSTAATRRCYSKSVDSENLKEINRILEEAESRLEETEPATSNVGTEFIAFQTNEANWADFKRSLECEICGFPVTKRRSSENYCGYSEVLPSRENIMEKAWTVCVGSSNEPYMEPTDDDKSSGIADCDCDEESYRNEQDILNELEKLLRKPDKDK
ncbi:uncharacterized protein LOC132697688 isoform X2 [Cylas formicarius]|uniref:uncharacterized protein LOC132697688 isoform X2 n=1 Tax=Cylas formicarius TaxID=197179 RepID=UPI002958773C|nr:uncharacterized protein LOC132697688 isoform X2 [Cylas formicarius]